MGAAHSSQPRSVSMDNPRPDGIIDISDDVVKRLRDGMREQAAEKKFSSKKETPSTPPPTPKQVPVKPAAPVKADPPPKVVYQAATPPTVVYQAPAPGSYVIPGGITITAADIRRQKDLELEENDNLWRQRMSELEQTLNKTNAIMEKEYSAAVNDVKARFANAPARHQLPPCQDLKAQLIACYRAYPGETLKCTQDVELFRNCVNAHRLKRLDAEKEEDKSTKTPAAKAG